MAKKHAPSTFYFFPCYLKRRLRLDLFFALPAPTPLNRSSPSTRSPSLVMMESGLTAVSSRSITDGIAGCILSSTFDGASSLLAHANTSWTASTRFLFWSNKGAGGGKSMSLLDSQCLL